jgi:hypothetical protein
MIKFKTLCDLDKQDIEKKLDEIAKIVTDPKYLCRKCARASNKKEYLCKPQRIKS